MTCRYLQLLWLTCKRTLARSTGAVTNVVGTADRKPAAASSGVESVESVRLGTTDRISLLEASYAYAKPCVRAHKPLPTVYEWSTQNERANIGVTPNSGGTTPRYNPVGPSLANIFFTTSRAPVYVLGAAVCSLVLVKSNG
jgi:hypothetical protein